MKKLIIIFLLLLSFTVYSVIVLRTPKTILYLLNWGEYINYDVVAEFEEKYNCQVVEECVISSEIMYQKIKSGTTKYDVAIPGDYVVHQLYDEDLLYELDVNNSNYEYLNKYETMFTDSLKGIMDEYMVSDNKNFNTYYMPYFWGAYSIIYSTRKASVENVIKNNGFLSLFDRSLYSEDVNIGMYETARWIVLSYLLSEGYNPNITTYNLDSSSNIITTGDIDDTLADDIVTAIKNAKFDEFGNDSLKRNVANGALDMCFTQLGDFFDALYLVYDEGDASSIEFNVNVPESTVAFFDAMVIPKTSQNKDLANKFINFMLNPDNAYSNAQAIGYCPTLKEVCNLYNIDALNGGYYYEDESGNNSLLLSDFLIKYPMYLNPLVNSDMSKVYLLEPKSNNYLTTCETIFNKGCMK